MSIFGSIIRSGVGRWLIISNLEVFAIVCFVVEVWFEKVCLVLCLVTFRCEAVNRNEICLVNNWAYAHCLLHKFWRSLRLHLLLFLKLVQDRTIFCNKASHFFKLLLPLSKNQNIFKGLNINLLTFWSAYNRSNDLLQINIRLCTHSNYRSNLVLNTHWHVNQLCIWL